MKISAIVSTHNSARFIYGCLEDLLNQTLYQKGGLEIIVIDSGSLENEGEIVRGFQATHERIKYLRTKDSESLYQAWNRGIKIASADYISNANTDDRHHIECLEILVNKLEKYPYCDISYGNLYKSSIPNETFENNDKSTPCYSQGFHPGSLLLHDFVGAQPVWRKSLHDRIGLFDESFEVVGDYDFFLKAASKGCRFIHEPKAEGLMLWHQSALSTRNSKGFEEKNVLFEKYRKPKKVIQFYKKNLSSKVFDPSIDSSLDLGIRSLCYFPQFASNTPRFDFKLAKNSFEQYRDNPIFKHNLSTLDQVTKLSDTNNEEAHVFYGTKERLPTEYELKQVPPTYLKKVGMDKFHGEYREKFIFNSKEFLRSLFSHLPIQNFTKYEQIFIYGYNERGKLLGEHLLNLGYNNINFVDNFLGKTKDDSSRLNFGIFSLEDLNPCMNVCFLLAMSSHHWKTVEEDVKKKCPQSTLFYLDPA